MAWTVSLKKLKKMLYFSFTEACPAKLQRSRALSSNGELGLGPKFTTGARRREVGSRTKSADFDT